MAEKVFFGFNGSLNPVAIRTGIDDRRLTKRNPLKPSDNPFFNERDREAWQVGYDYAEKLPQYGYGRYAKTTEHYLR